jgi:hypothetical protein
MNHPANRRLTRTVFALSTIALLGPWVSDARGAVTALTIQKVEVTQAIQCLDQSHGYTNCEDNSLELTTNRPVAVRVYLTHDGVPISTDPFAPILRDVPVTLRWIATHEDYPSGYVPEEWQVLADVPGETDLRKLRNDTRGAVNFVIPPYQNSNPNDPSERWWLLGNPNKENLLWIEAEVDFQGTKHTLEMQLGGKDAQGNDLPGGLFPRDPIRVTWVFVYYNPKPPPNSPPQLKKWADSRVGSYDRFMHEIFPRPVQYMGTGGGFVDYDHLDCPAEYQGCPHTAFDYNPLLYKLGKHYFFLQQQYSQTPELIPDVVVGWLPNTVGPPGVYLDDAAFVVEKPSRPRSEQALAHEVAHADKVSGALDIGTVILCETGILEAGFNVFSRAALEGDYFNDVMTWNIGDWISPYTWKEMLGQGGECLAPVSSSSASELTADWEQPAVAKQPAMSTATQPTVLIGGRVNLNGTGALDYPLQLDSSGPFDTSDPAGEYCLDLNNGAGVLLWSHCFDLFTGACRDCGPSEEEMFVFALPLAVGTEKILLRRNGTVLDAVTRSPNAPSLAVSTPPDDPETLQWTATDADGDVLRYTVLYSYDGGASWSPIAVDVTRTSVSTRISRLAGGNSSMFRVLASDGFNTSSADTGTVYVTRKAPFTSIRVPMDQAFVSRADDFVMLIGSAWDGEDGVLGGTSLRWDSSIDGLLGYGKEVYVKPSSISSGRHLLTLTAEDDDGDTTTATVMLDVGNPVGIDIKPGSFPNSLRIKSRGTIPVALLSTGDFDAGGQTDVSSLTFGRTGTEESLAFCTSGLEDVDGDGLMDLVCHFRTRLTGFQCGDREGVLKGETMGGTPLQGMDSVRLVPCGQEKK